ncbi:RNA polymerase sigma factor [Chitinophaga pinensis]|uniref:RNA polymerase, sigma-24 subunit, ECF subfamily n=1 Tax=Chitinophaga pinensis (strain ATCC 43595 / DSM 2588 / LMG 13176 / NBRC 15968 / NCIMB 11800 / UQM 2034) TaxID=485918 RepID=A0A979G5I6_CHIPD|nr:sigma-70 family RNA polymerase sigma factor [Chitinophaga pinensis]ACU61269.1 RNA polymerase, sigma-24 subunit, ECF subfamily [Chitinophaga pinensis DSM 2588]
MENIEDAELLLAIKNGSEKAFGTLYKKYQRFIALKISYMFGDPGEADDIVQDVFAEYWIKKEQINVHTDCRGYLLRAAINRANNKLNKRKTDYNREQRYSRAAPPFDDPSAHKDSLSNEVVLALDKYLPAADSNIMKQVYLEGRKQQEVADELNISLPTLRGVIVRSGKALRKIFKK